MARSKNPEMMQIKVDQITRRYKALKQKFAELKVEKAHEVKQLRSELRGHKAEMKTWAAVQKRALSTEKSKAYELGLEQGLLEAQAQMDDFIKQLAKEEAKFERNYKPSQPKRKQNKPTTKARSKIEPTQPKTKTRSKVEPSQEKTIEEQVVELMDEAKVAFEHKALRSSEPVSSASKESVIESV